MHFKATSPAEAADILQHCITNDGIGIFNRQRPDGAINKRLKVCAAFGSNDLELMLNPLRSTSDATQSSHKFQQKNFS